MSVIDQIRQDREDLARVLKKHPGIRKTFEDFYPDTAHFIYELFQNAEDVGASEVTFVLYEDALVFEHNGSPFNEADIWGITDFGEGTKASDDDQIGRFGIGFKAVFVYTETPHIWSPNYSFKISDMVLPSALPSNPDLGERTRFKFPFDSMKKPQNEAFSEVQAGLEEISDSTLLFLSKIKKIQWRVDGGREGRLRRTLKSDHHVEIFRKIDGEPIKSSHFLRFTEPVEGLERQFVAVAFELEPLSNDGQMDALASFAERFRIVPAERGQGRVAVYFTAEKETSNLRFHLHAPFVPEVSRASIKDRPANVPLFQQLAALAAKSLCKICDLGLLNRDFLAVLPNSGDSIPERYKVIRQAIVDAMNGDPLTPTQSGGHAPAGQLLQGEARLKSLLRSDDIRFLLDGDDNRCDWAVAATQMYSRVDHFLDDLDIKQWGVEEFVGTLDHRCSDKVENLYYPHCLSRVPDPKFLDWMRKKPMDWHRALYVLFHERKLTHTKFKYVCIVRCSDDKFRKGSDCFFPTPETQEDPAHPRVAEGTVTSGNAKQQEDARAFLEGIGVREVGERERVEAILKRRYADPGDPPSWETHGTDLRRFIALTGEEGSTASLFEKYCIFKRADGGWSRPDGLYLDSPYLETGLRAYYDPLGSESGRAALSANYKDFNMRAKLIDFAKLCGVAHRLEIVSTTCDDNPCREYLKNAPGSFRNETSVNRDFVIPELSELLKKPNLDLSCLIWKTLCDASNDENFLRATFRQNQSRDPRDAPSQLVHHLRNADWIPQRDDQFVRPAKAYGDWLPCAFQYNPNWQWLKAIDFGTETENRIEECRRIEELAAALGFASEAELEDAQEFVKLCSSDVRRMIIKEHTSKAGLPESKSGNPKERSKRVREKARRAPVRKTENRPLSVSVNQDAIKEEAKPYLRDQYTNDDGDTICQACQDSLPFRLADGNYYFEAVEFLPGLKRHHCENYLILCPNHAAMFMYANNFKDEIKDRFMSLDGNKLAITLAGQKVFLYFTDTHVADLRDIIEVDDEE